MNDGADISMYVLAHPDSRNRCKGAIVLSSVDAVVRHVPNVRRCFYIVERRGWAGPNDALNADIKLVEDLSTCERTAIEHPQSVLLDIGPADFVDTDVFTPLGCQKPLGAIMVARWNRFKRHKLFIRAAAQLSTHRFAILGHFAEGGTPEELALREDVCAFARENAPNVTMMFAHATSNRSLFKEACVMNRLINLARVGVVTSRVEGINRFKMECLAANVPVSVRADACEPLRKHVNKRTGALFDGTPDGLVEALRRLWADADISPRRYVLENTGMRMSLIKLETALNRLAVRDGYGAYFRLTKWDGRNNSMLWGDRALAWLQSHVVG